MAENTSGCPVRPAALTARSQWYLIPGMCQVYPTIILVGHFRVSMLFSLIKRPATDYILTFDSISGYSLWIHILKVNYQIRTYKHCNTLHLFYQFLPKHLHKKLATSSNVKPNQPLISPPLSIVILEVYANFISDIVFHCCFNY